MENKNTGDYNHLQLTMATLWVMTIATGLVVANIYYNQPLLGDIAAALKVSGATASFITTLTLIGYAVGILFLVPLADMKERKKLIMIDFALIIASLLLAALSPNISILIIAGFFIGVTSVVTQMLVPMAAHLAKPSERGKKVGFIMSGLLIGILLSRTVSGFIGHHLGWRAIYFIATGLMLMMWVLLYFLLPKVEPEYKGTYGELMSSLIDLIKTEPKLRVASLRGALCFACFSAFWTTLVFLLKEPQFNLSSQAAGAFGLVGVAGALGAPIMGRISDNSNPYPINTVTILLIVFSFVIFYFFRGSIIGLAVGVILLDLGVQATHISNQTLIFSLQPEARNRLNTVYMVTYFIGGSAGSYIASVFWNHYKWIGVCAAGLTFALLALLVHLFNRSVLADKKN